MATETVEILSREELEQYYKKVAQSYGYSGEILNILIKLLTECSYLTSLNSGSILREGSLLTSIQLDSMLAICHDNFTPVDRGSCQRLLIDNLYVNQNREVKAYELLESKSSNYKLYFAQDGTYDTNDGLVNLSLIVGSDLVSYENTKEADNRLSSNTHIIDLPDDNLSEDFLFYKNERMIYNVDDIPISLHTDEKYKGYMFTKNPKLISDIIPYYICTVPPNFSVRIYGYERFLVSDKYTFKCIRKVNSTTPDMSISLLKSLQGFIYKDNTPSIKSISSINAENSISALKMKVISNFRDRNYISSYNAIKNAIEEKLMEYFLGFAINIIKGQILITYALKDNSAWGVAVENKFREEIVFDYKIEEKLVFEQAKDKEVPLYINIYYSNKINEMEIGALIDEYEKKVGGEYSIDALKSYLDKQENISYVEIIPDYDELMRTSGTRVPLEGEENVLNADGQIMTNDDGTNVTKRVIYRLRFKPRDVRYISIIESN